MLEAPGELTASLPVTAVFGATGFIGRHLLAELLRCRPETVGFVRSEGNELLSLDLSRPNITTVGLKQLGITHAVIAMAVSGIAACERDPAATRKVNVEGTVELARQLCQEGIKVVALSSDYVFDGIRGNYDETSPVGALNEYGRQKVEMEVGLAEVCSANVLILRLSKVFNLTRGSGTLLDEMAGRLIRGEQLSAAWDQFFCPTLVDDVVKVIRYLLTTDASGLMHLCAPTRTSRIDLARSIVSVFNLKSNLVNSISLRNLQENFVRPLDTSMVCPRLASYIRYDFKDVRECIEELKSNYCLDGHGKTD